MDSLDAGISPETLNKLTMRKKRVVVGGILNHCYQRTAGGNLIFYCVSDHLVFFTELCCIARDYREKIRILSLCSMPDHIHLSIVAASRSELSAFVREYSARFAKKHNAICHRKGALFKSPYGSVPKRGDKKARTNLIYLGNNPVERHLCAKAEEYRWNFLAYAVSDHPFSDPLVLRNASWHLRCAIREIKQESKNDRPLSYRQLKRIFKGLDKREREQLTDFIITAYNVIDYPSAIRFFDTYEDMLTAMHANTGSEYDLNEVFHGKTDRCYAEMTAIAIRETGVGDIHDILAFPPDRKHRLLLRLSRLSDASLSQVRAFLQL